MWPLVPTGTKGRNGLPLEEMRNRAPATFSALAVAVALVLGVLPAVSAGKSTPSGVATGPWGLNISDVTGDGLPDVLIATGGGNTVRLLVNNLRSTADSGNDPLPKRWALDKSKQFLDPGLPADAGNTPTDVATADIDGDGAPEILIPRSGDDKFGVLKVDPATGNLTPYSLTRVAGTERETLTGSVPVNIGAADINSDGCVDAVTVNTASREFGVFLGTGPNFLDTTGTGSFFLPQVLPYPQAMRTANGLVVGDFNGDKKIDMASANAGDRTISIQINRGWSTSPIKPNGEWKWPAAKKGTFPPVTFTDSAKNRLASYTYDATTQRYALVPGSGSTTSACGKDPSSPIDWNLNYDGDQPRSPINPAVNGQPTFRLITQGAGYAPIHLAGGDFNNDNLPDMVTGSTLDGTVAIMMSTPTKRRDAAFKVAPILNVGSCASGQRMPQVFATGDWDGDKKVDIAVTSPSCRDVILLRNLGKNKWSAPYVFVLPDGADPGPLKLGDLTGDGKADLVVTDLQSGRLFVAISKGIAQPASPMGLSYDVLTTDVLLNQGPTLLTAPALTDGDRDCGTPGARSACSPRVADGMSVDPGAWVGADAAAAAGFDYTYTYTWERRKGFDAWSTIPGQTDSAYSLTLADKGSSIRACVTAYAGQVGGSGSARIPSASPACTNPTRVVA